MFDELIGPLPIGVLYYFGSVTLKDGGSIWVKGATILQSAELAKKFGVFI